MFVVTNRTGDLDDEKIAIINGYARYLFDINIGCDVIYDNTVALANELRKMSLADYDEYIKTVCRSREYARYKHYYEYTHPDEHKWLAGFREYMINTKKGDLTRDEIRRASQVISYFSLKYDGLMGIASAIEEKKIPKSEVDRKYLSCLKEYLSQESAGMIDIPAFDNML